MFNCRRNNLIVDCLVEFVARTAVVEDTMGMINLVGLDKRMGDIIVYQGAVL